MSKNRLYVILFTILLFVTQNSTLHADLTIGDVRPTNSVIPPRQLEPTSSTDQADTTNNKSSLTFVEANDLSSPNTYPLIVDTLLDTSDDVSGGKFGESVSLNSTGTVALIGSPSNYADYPNNSYPGAAYIFVNNTGIWTEQAKLVNQDSTQYDYFGVTTSLSADGNTAVVGANNAVYIFKNNTGIWTEQQKLTASDGTAEDGFGLSIALSTDGSTLAVGAWADDIGNIVDQGSTYIFTINGGIWTEQAKLVAVDGMMADYFGNAVALSADGNTALIGANYDDIDPVINLGGGQGTAYIFTRNGSTWTQSQHLIASDGQDMDDFGRAVALSADGSTALITAASDNIEANIDQGSAYIFANNMGIWTEQQKLFIGDSEVKYFGWTATLSLAGNISIITSDWSKVAYGFMNVQGVWTQTGKIGSEGLYDAFGISSALDAAGTALIGNPYGYGNTGQGVVYVLTSDSNQLLSNPGFEIDANANRQPDYWTLKNKSQDKVICNTSDLTYANSGRCAYRFKGTMLESTTLSQSVKNLSLPPGHLLYLTGYYKAVTVPKLKVQIKTFYLDGFVDQTSKVINSSTSIYMDFSLSYMVTWGHQDVTKVKVQLQNRAMGGKVYIDDIRLNGTPGRLYPPNNDGFLPLPPVPSK